MARFYIRDLAAYTNGIEHGTWIGTDEHSDETELQSAIDAVLASSPIPHAEEWELADCEGITLELARKLTVPQWAIYAELTKKHGGAYEAWANDSDYQDYAMDEDYFLEQYAGEGKWEDFVYDFVQDVYGHEMAQLPETLRCHFDYKSFGRDLAYDYNVIGNYIFRCT